METALEWKDISYSVRTGFWLRRKSILKGVSLSLPRGSAVGLVGPNGAGKTTTIKIGAGLVRPDSGHVCTGMDRPEDVAARGDIGLLTELQYFYPHVTVREWLRFLGLLTGRSPAFVDKNISFYTRELELEGLLSQQMKNLSKGQSQRVGLAQALVHGPGILLLDEPMSGLDPYWRYRVLRLLQDFRAQGGSILFSSHILADVEELCQKIVLMQDGEIHWQGDMEEVRKQIKGYRVICPMSAKDVLENWPGKVAVQNLPDQGISILLEAEEKDDFLRFALSEGIEVSSINPQFMELEEVLFGLHKEAA